MKISSTAFEAGGPIPVKHTYDGDDRSPPLTFEDAPEGTQSYALFVEDLDEPAGPRVQFLAYDIPAKAKGLPQSIAVTERVPGGGQQGRNGFRRMGWAGPCPKRGSGPHRYRFRLVALDVPATGLAAGATREELTAAIEGHILAEAELLATYER